ncbi:hypothetical protein CDEST_13444 [Colletotrichum destructivum]|uniref:Uncharacterized protein n=1 Tax=Colletotrichum destructivum TaxID=34406 RepID=A0AAX4IYZ3_9PEZI|nr:hypothetical protein CDEST_13444 [Colletotrichum destructivum]
MLDGYDRNQEERARGPSMDIDEKSTAFSQAQISTPPSASTNRMRHTINTAMMTTIIPEPTPPPAASTPADPQRRFSWLPRSATPSLRSPTFRRRAASPFYDDDDDDDYPYSDSSPFGEDFREQNEQAGRDWDRDHGHDHDHDGGDNPFEDCEYELPPAAGKREGTWTKFKKAMSPKRAISKWKYRKVKHGGFQPDDPDHGDRGGSQGQAS